MTNLTDNRSYHPPDSHPILDRPRVQLPAEAKDIPISTG